MFVKLFTSPSSLPTDKAIPHLPQAARHALRLRVLVQLQRKTGAHQLSSKVSEQRVQSIR